MKSVKQINIERLTKADKAELVELASDLNLRLGRLQVMAALYEGKTHTKLDRIALELGDAINSLEGLTGEARQLDLVAKSDNLNAIVKSSV